MLILKIKKIRKSVTRGKKNLSIGTVCTKWTDEMATNKGSYQLSQVREVYYYHKLEDDEGEDLS